jgi:hypothetical protein
VQEKRHHPLWFYGMTVGFWFGGKIAVAIIAALLFVSAANGCVVYLFVLLGSAFGAGITYYVANILSPAAKDPNFDDINPFD